MKEEKMETPLTSTQLAQVRRILEQKRIELFAGSPLKRRLEEFEKGEGAILNSYKAERKVFKEHCKEEDFIELGKALFDKWVDLHYDAGIEDLIQETNVYKNIMKPLEDAARKKQQELQNAIQKEKRALFQETENIMSHATLGYPVEEGEFPPVGERIKEFLLR